MTVKRLGGMTVWVGIPAFGDPCGVVVGTARNLVLSEIGSTERRYESAVKKGGDVVVRGKEGMWRVLETDLLRVVRKGSGFGSTGKDGGRSVNWEG